MIGVSSSKVARRPGARPASGEAPWSEASLERGRTRLRPASREAGPEARPASSDATRSEGILDRGRLWNEAASGRAPNLVPPSGTIFKMRPSRPNRPNHSSRRPGPNCFPVLIHVGFARRARCIRRHLPGQSSFPLVPQQPCANKIRSRRRDENLGHRFRHRWNADRGAGGPGRRGPTTKYGPKRHLYI